MIGREMRRGGFIHTFKSLPKTQRACIMTEPLWGIPYYLYIPYAALYMQALGMSLEEIGYVASVSLVAQVLTSLISGPLTDKYGRRFITFITDFVAWTIPYVLWALARDMRWFVIAAVFNATRRVAMTSWNLLMCEDCEPNTVVKCFSLIQLTGLTAGFFVFISQWGVESYGLIPMMRVLYWFGGVCMTAKAFILYYMSDETIMGKRRMQETRHQSLLTLLLGSGKVLKKLFRDKQVLYALGVLAAYQSVNNLNETFWSLYIVDKLGIGQGGIAPYILLRSVALCLCVLFLVPRLRFERFKRPMLVCWALYIVSQGMLLLGQFGWAIAAIALNVVLEAVAMSVVSPMADSLLVVGAQPEERARILGLTYAAMLVPVSIFPALAGLLTRYFIGAPFMLNITLCAAGAGLTLLLWRERSKAA